MPHEWRAPEPVEVPVALRDAVGGHALIARLLAQRGIVDPERARAYLDPAVYRPASPLDLPGTAEAVRLLRETIAAGRRVRVWGDFDADGQTSTAVLVETLAAAGARVDYGLPRRSESHGLAPRAVDDALRDGIALLLTCDTGVGEYDVVAQAEAAGLAVIVTDHHDLPERLPPARSVVNPKMLPASHPLRALSGVGVAYMLARALLEGSSRAATLEGLLDLVALGLVADVAEQVDDVRYLIQRGVQVLRSAQRPGLRALAQAAGFDLVHLSEEDIAYQLGPRLNAAGRLADAEEAVRLLLTQDATEAEALAQRLEALNRDRRARTEATQAEVEERLRQDAEALHKPAIVLESAHWEPGVLGLVASDLARRYGRPTILIAHRPSGPSTASARSVAGIDIHRAIASQSQYLVREGGHPMAAGFAIAPEHVDAFRRGLWEWLEREAPPIAEPMLAYDAEVPWEEVTLELARQLQRLAPYGAGNERPVLVTAGGMLARSEDVSRRRPTLHRHLYLDDESGRPLRFTWFNAGALPEPGERLEVAFGLSVEHWHGKERLQLALVDWRPAPQAERRARTHAAAELVAGRDVLDWRRRGDPEPLLAALRAEWGDRLAIWAEGLAEPLADGRTRSQMAALATDQEHGSVSALAVLTPPPEPDALRRVLAQAKPQVVVLLPPRPVSEDPPEVFLTQVAGMLRVALRDHGGRLDLLRMASRVAARQAAVLAALRGLEVAGRIVLRYEADGLHAYPPPLTPSLADAMLDEPEVEEQRVARMAEAVHQARAALDYQLRETYAYRRAYATLPVEALLVEG
ncbi:MAG: single-stranded-DNA-specific exonuclease RecJ [Anaerolineae bacterium]